MAAPRVRRRGLTQRDRLTLTVMTVGTVLLVTALFLFNDLKPAPTEFGSVSAVAVTSAVTAPVTPGVTSRSSAPPATVPAGPTVAPAAAPTSAVPAAPAAPVASAGTPASDGQTPSAPVISAAAPATDADAPADTPAPTGTPAPAATAEPPVTSTPAVPPPARAAVAQSISIPVLGVTAPIHPIGSTNGIVDVPEDPAEVGFYTGSVLPGSSAGSTVLVGHVNYANVPGALIGLTEVHEGDLVDVATLGGQTVHYRITAREVVLKSEGLPADLFVTDGPPRLVLITCGGPFDEVAQRYEDNVVVVAVPVT